MNEGRSWLFYIGIVVAVLGLILLLIASAPLGFYLGTVITCIGLIVFGMGLRARLKDENPTLGAIVLLGSIAGAAVLAWLAYVSG
jgi:hypothetical protein